MSLSFGLNPLLLVAAALAAGGLTFWMYRMTVPPLSRGRRVALGALRFIALFLVIFLLFEPILRLVESEERPPVMAVLIDDSRSIVVTSGADTSEQNVRERIRHLSSSFPRELASADVHFFSFSDGVRSASIDSLDFDGERTNIAGALEDLRERFRDENLAAVVLVSDGQYNSGRNPLYVAERFPVPIHTVVLGDTSRQRDVQIRRVTTNEIAYVDTELPVQVEIRTEDYGGEEVTVSLRQDGNMIASESVTLPEGASETTVDLTIRPDRAGLHRYEALVTRLPEEVTYRNNAESFTVRVLESKRRVLLLAGGPDPDVAAVRQLLSDERAFDVDAFVQKGEGTFYEGSPQRSLSQYDAIILAGFPGRSTGSILMDEIRDAADDGVPILFILTRATDIAAMRHFTENVLPVVPEAVRSGDIEVVPVPTQRARRHPVMDVDGGSFELWRRLPPLLASQTRWSASPDAEVLATTEVRGVALDDPLIVVRRRTQSRSAAVLGAGTWRWNNVPEDLAAVEELWPSLFSNLLQWLTTREDDRPVRVVPVRDLFGGGERVQLTGQVYDESLQPVDDAAVEVRISGADGAVYPYAMESIGNGRYTLDAGSLPEGSYNYEAVARKSDETLGSDGGAFAVGALTLEFKETRANAALMRQIAQRSNGMFLDNEEPEALTERLAQAGTFSSITVEREEEIPLRRRYIFLAIIIGALAVEWFFRKRSGMV